MNTITLILSIVLLCCAAALIVIITLQGDRSASSSAVTGDFGSYYNKNRTQTKEIILKRATVCLSILFMVIVCIVNIVESL